QALVHGRPAGIEVERVDAADDLFNPVPLGDGGGRQEYAGAVGEADDGQGVLRPQSLQGADGRLLDALEPTDAGAVLLVPGPRHAEGQSQVQAQRPGGARRAAGDQLEQGVTGRGLAGDGDAAAVHHALEVDAGGHAWLVPYGVSTVPTGHTLVGG